VCLKHWKLDQQQYKHVIEVNTLVFATYHNLERLVPLLLLCRFGQLQAVDVSGVQPAVHARDEGNVLRPDEPATYANRCVQECHTCNCTCPCPAVFSRRGCVLLGRAASHILRAVAAAAQVSQLYCIAIASRLAR
jgi:hypothetical protein